MKMYEASSWIVCQIGARENFAVARALARRDALEALLTDVWCPPASPFRSFLGRFGDRCHQELRHATVWAPTAKAVAQEVADWRCSRSGWTKILRRNNWFQDLAARRLKQFHPEGNVTVFAYSYAAAKIFKQAKSRGWRTVLGQIDPGPIEARLVKRLYDRAQQSNRYESIPTEYWENWWQEIELADVIAVNSHWSRRGLISEGVQPKKISVVPLAYEKVALLDQWDKPKKFTVQRPLRLLFLGQVTLRKGIDIVLDALTQLPDAPLKLDVVGPLQIDLPDTAQRDPRIEFHGSVPRHAASRFYQLADIFLFPTRSDGFGLTQLEAISAGVPVIASDRCGSVVKDGKNGYVLNNLEAGRLATLIDLLSKNPNHVAALRQEARSDNRFTIDSLGLHLMKLENTESVPKK